MRRILVFALILVGLTAPVALAQELYTHDKVDYSFELPSASVRANLVHPGGVVARPEARDPEHVVPVLALPGDESPIDHEPV